jgi:hypothetical protein
MMTLLSEESASSVKSEASQDVGEKAAAEVPVWMLLLQSILWAIMPANFTLGANGSRRYRALALGKSQFNFLLTYFRPLMSPVDFSLLSRASLEITLGGVEI